MAKIAGIKLCQSYRQRYGSDFISAMPTNLYGPNDNFDLTSSHVLPAMIRKFHDAKEAGRSEVTIWGSGTPKREFLHVDDLADACVFLMDQYSGSQHINVGTGEDVAISELAEMIRRVVYPDAKIVYDTSRPDGTPRKVARCRPAAVTRLATRHCLERRDQADVRMVPGQLCQRAGCGRGLVEAIDIEVFRA